jgi:hypothetical protein
VLNSQAQNAFSSRDSYPQIYPQRTVPTVPFSNLAAPAGERKSLVIRVCLDCHGRGREFESRRPRHFPSIRIHCRRRVASVSMRDNVPSVPDFRPRFPVPDFPSPISPRAQHPLILRLRHLGSIAKSGKDELAAKLAGIRNSKKLYFGRRCAVPIRMAHSKTGGFCTDGGN